LGVQIALHVTCRFNAASACGTPWLHHLCHASRCYVGLPTAAHSSVIGCQKQLLHTIHLPSCVCARTANPCQQHHIASHLTACCLDVCIGGAAAAAAAGGGGGGAKKGRYACQPGCWRGDPPARTARPPSQDQAAELHVPRTLRDGVWVSGEEAAQVALLVLLVLLVLLIALVCRCFTCRLIWAWHLGMVGGYQALSASRHRWVCSITSVRQGRFTSTCTSGQVLRSLSSG
jgi:hypothetical protein